MKVGIISDTHGLLREEVLHTFKNCDFIFHGGDIGGEKIIDRLSEIAPVSVVRGNNDKDTWARNLPNETWSKLGGRMFYMIHNLKESKIVFDSSEINIVISGHSHIYKEEQVNDIYFLNPGAAGPRRFGRPATVMILEINDDFLTVDMITF